MKEKIAILGLGYVGLTLSLALANKKNYVIGYDSNPKVIDNLNSYKSYIYEKNLHNILKKTLNKNFILTKQLPRDVTIYIVTVGTPVEKNKKNKKYIPILDQVKEICTELTSVIENKPLIIFRSTLPIGSSRNIIEPIFRNKKLFVGKDYYLAFAPERTIEGNAINELSELPQIIAGYDKKSSQKCKKFSSEVIDVENLESAEIIKLINNSYRDLSFAYANQVAIICNKYGLSANKIIKFSNYNYPRSLIPTASPGVGGPCLTKDPYILNQEVSGNKETIFTIGRKVNENIVDVLINGIMYKLNKIKNKNIKILLCGLSFKGNPPTKDFRDSSTIKFFKILNNKKKYKVFLCDPLFKSSELKNLGFNPGDFKNTKYDCIVFLNNNEQFRKISLKEINNALNYKGLIYDFWSVLSNKIKVSDRFQYHEIGQK